MAHLAYKNEKKRIVTHSEVIKSEFIVGFSVVDLVEKCLVYYIYGMQAAGLSNFFEQERVIVARLTSKVCLINHPKFIDSKLTTLNAMVNSDLVTSGGVTIHIFIFVSYQ